MKSLMVVILINFFAPAFAQEISFSTGKYGQKYYHLKFKINAQNVIPAFGQNKYDSARSFDLDKNSRPQLFIKKELFPIKARIGHTHSYWILTFPDFSKYPDLIPTLYDPIKKLLDTKKGEKEFILEFHYGYVKEIAEDPLNIEVSEINLSFRTAHGKYIPYLGQLKKN